MPVLLVGLTVPAGGQSPPPLLHESWATQDGLPVNAVNNLAQTSDGYLWLATFDGLARYDGHRFTVFNTANTPSLPSNRIVEIVETPDDVLWIRTEFGDLARLRNGTFEAVEASDGLVGSPVFTLYLDGEGTLWIGTAEGVSRYRDGRLEPYGRLRPAASQLYRDCDGTLWAGTWEDGLYALLENGARHYTSANRLIPDRITALEGDDDCTLWIGSSEGLLRYRDEALTTVADFSEWIFSLTWFQGALWAAHAGGISVLDGRHLEAFEVKRREWAPDVLVMRTGDGSRLVNTGDRVFRDDEILFSVDGDIIRDVIEDREGNIWAATGRSGLHRWRPVPFRVFGRPEGASGQNVYPVTQDRDGYIWFGTWDGGLNRLDREGVIRPYTPTDGLLGQAISALHVDRRGRLWVGSNAGVCRFERQTCTPFMAAESHWRDVRAILEDRNGSLWFGTPAGLMRFRDGTWARFTTADGLGNNNVRAIHQARDGTVWFGTNGGGLNYYRNGRIATITVEDGLPSNLIRSIYEDAEGVLWIGTEDRGLARIEHPPSGGGSAAQQPVISAIRQQDGLFDNVIHQILEDDDGRLWMSTNRGIFWVDRRDLNDFAEGRLRRIESVAYTERDGLRNREANGGAQPAGVRSRDGRLWFPTQDGLAVIDPRDVGGYEVPVMVEAVRVDGDMMALTAPAVLLSAAQRSFEIEYAAAAFRDAEKVRFQYMLEGFDDAWMDAGNRRTAYYTRVQPGTYAFRVRAKVGGAWSELNSPVMLRIAPFFYETRWFILLCLAAVLVLAWAGVQWRINILKRRERELELLVAERTAQIAAHEAQLEIQNARLAEQAEKLKDLDEAKSRFFANVTHEFRTPLTLILGPLQHAMKGGYGSLTPELREQMDLMERNGFRLLRLINQLLDLARLEAGGYQVQPVVQDLLPYLENIVQAFVPLAERRRVKLSLVGASSPCIVQFDEEAVEKVLSNLLSNALKFTEEGGSVTVSLRVANAFAEVSVEDTGIGIPPENLPHIFERFYQAEASTTRQWEGTGIGLALVRELIELQGGSIEVVSRPGEGSRFTVRLPVPDAPSDVPVEFAGGDIRASGDGSGDTEIAVANFDHHTLSSLVAEAPATAPAATSLSGDFQEGEDDTRDVTTVLVVDDNADLRAYMRRILSPEFRVLEAGDGLHALDEITTELPDLVIADVMMPRMDGFALVRALRENPMTDCIPVIMLTARAAAGDEVHGLETGADDYVTKPFDADVLLAKARNLIALRMRLRDRFREDPPAFGAPPDRHPPVERRAREIVESHLLDSHFSVEVLASEMAMSRSQLFRKLRDEAGVTPVQLIRTVRVENAARLFCEQAGTVSEVGYAVGFESLSHFTRCFRERFGVAPSEFLKARSYRAGV